MMILDEAITRLDQGQTFFIGASSGWIFIGNRNAYERRIEALSGAIYEEHRKRYTSYLNRLQMALKEPKKTYAIRMGNHTYYRSYKSYVKSLSRMLKLYESVYLQYVPLRERLVLDVYNKYVDRGIAIIIEGQERGPYWLESEYKKNEQC